MCSTCIYLPDDDNLGKIDFYVDELCNKQTGNGDVHGATAATQGGRQGHHKPRHSPVQAVLPLQTLKGLGDGDGARFKESCGLRFLVLVSACSHNVNFIG